MAAAYSLAKFEAQTKDLGHDRFLSLIGWPWPNFNSSGVIARVLDDPVYMWMTSITAGVLLAHIGDSGFRARGLDLERCDERVFSFNRHLIRLVSDLDPDRIS